MKFNLTFRILLGISCIVGIYSLYLPLWEIYLWAPQYPEGLSVQIWHNAVSGDVDVINGLNHYIGMKHIKTEMFPEFGFLRYIILLFIAFGLFVSVSGQLKWLRIYFTSTVAGGIIALADFYRWGYDYGHNLDPTAPIQVPGMAYQPPVIGYKDLLNFTALSMPASGGWLIISIGIISFFALAFHWFITKKKKTMGALSVLFLLGLIQSCSEKAVTISFGEDDCAFCKMKIMDNKYGMAIQTPKGKTYKFDDYHCYQNFLKDQPIDIAKTYVVCFDQPGTLIEAAQSSYAFGPEIKSPMGGGIAFFKQAEHAKKSFKNIEKEGTFKSLLNE